MCCYEDRWARVLGYTGKSYFDPKAKRQIYRAAQIGVTRIEAGDIDILGSKGEDARAVFQLSRSGPDSRAGQSDVANQNFWRGIAPDPLPRAFCRRLEHVAIAHVPVGTGGTCRLRITAIV